MIFGMIISSGELPGAYVGQRPLALIYILLHGVTNALKNYITISIVCMYYVDDSISKGCKKKGI